MQRRPYTTLSDATRMSVAPGLPGTRPWVGWLLLLIVACLLRLRCSRLPMRSTVTKTGTLGVGLFIYISNNLKLALGGTTAATCCHGGPAASHADR